MFRASLVLASLCLAAGCGGQELSTTSTEIETGPRTGSALAAAPSIAELSARPIGVPSTPLELPMPVEAGWGEFDLDLRIEGLGAPAGTPVQAVMAQLGCGFFVTAFASAS